MASIQDDSVNIDVKVVFLILSGLVSRIGGAADGSRPAGHSAPHHHWYGFLRHGKGGNHVGDCVGPASFCQIYFGS
ncbi:hypothetical protein [Paraburkholderia rhizosphaerae]|uniref:Uncharacterized protein n=1 Tax=Paraburkholderia rhizosphaerae TaxID=480658 RepID=A0A4R8L9S7_9BURK|nr:hypothetical protein [Paraburkholderia rhizosphaerae]TDY38829.1 hypothetical protein BX592_13055 [Paraburkholderia rhizosphaerae]